MNRKTREETKLKRKEKAAHIIFAVLWLCALALLIGAKT